MDRINAQTLKHFVEQTYHWSTLPSSDQMKMAKELYHLRECIDAAVAAGYGLNREFTAFMDAFNVITHRPD